MTYQSKRMLASASAVAVTVMAWTAISPGAAVVVADEAQARRLLKAMTEYVGAQKAISFDYDANLEVVTKDRQKLALAASGTVSLLRPDKIRATRSGSSTSCAASTTGPFPRPTCSSPMPTTG
jgi:hypothetical protein